MLTTTFVLLECGNAASRNPLLRSLVADARRRLEHNGLLIVPTEQDWTEAWAAYERGDAANAGIVNLGHEIAFPHADLGLLDDARVHRLSQGENRPSDPAVMPQLVAFIAHGMRGAIQQSRTPAARRKKA